MKRLILSGIAATALTALTMGTAFAQTTPSTQSVSDQDRAMVIAFEGNVNTSSTTNSSSMSPNVVIGGGGGGQAYYPNGVAVEPGDILITNGPNADSWTGHAGTVVDSSGDIATIDGYNDNPTFQSLSSFFSSEDGHVMVKRYPNSTVRNNSATWATNYVYDDPNAPYGIVWASLYAHGPSDETYCSKIAFDAFYYGGGVTLPYSVDDAWGDYCVPYDLSNDSYMTTEYNNM